ncbi:MAG: response regulator [Candidatus Cloacimonetes bacterium]|nr:response regulator [Candidatus Cloacimonadota bacterium]
MKKNKQTILIVDDLESNIDLLSEMLKTEWNIKVAMDGEKALQIANRQPYPDMILLDILMPEMDGYEVCKRLKANPVTKDIPVIFITALNKSHDQTYGLSLGAIDYITKPFNASITKARINNHLELRRLSLQYEKVFDGTSDSLVLVETDEKGLFHYLRGNKTHQEITGFNPEKLKGKTPTEIYGKEMGESLAAKYHQCLSENRSIYFEENIDTKDGERVLFTCITPIIVKGKNDCIVSSSTDITDLKKAEEEKLNLEKRLQQSHRLETIGTLAGGIAHDFNNILTPILGYAELALRSISQDTHIEEMLVEIKRSANRAKELVRQILSFNCRMENDMKLVSLQDIISSTMKFIRTSIPATINISVNLNESVGRIMADSSQINQVIVNICTNAYQAMTNEKGDILIELITFTPDEKFIEYHPSFENKEYALMKISDTGTGIPETIIDRIFEPFFTTKEVDKGTGLGLSVVHGIVKAHKGEICAESTPERGTIISVYFPVAKEVQSSSGNGIIGKNKMIKENSIIVVDDNKSVLKVISLILKKSGYKVKSFSCGKEAWSFARDNLVDFDLLISDLTMPRITGIELAKSIYDINPDFPVLILSGYGRDYSENPVGKYGIKKVLAKPIETETLIKAVKDLIRN